MKNSFLEKIQSTKFIIVAFVLIVSSIGLFMMKISGTEYTTLVGILTGFYTTANIIQKKIESSNNNDK
jgi:predicted PurR-regulated permease PerM